MSVRSPYRKARRSFKPGYARCEDCGRPYPLATFKIPKGRGGVIGHVVKDKNAECHACRNNRESENEKANRRVNG